MPFRYVAPSASLVLVCINHDIPGHEQAIVPPGTTMRVEDNWASLIAVDPGAMTTARGTIATLSSSVLQVVRAYTCTVCGYVELYDARITDPTIWRGPPPGMVPRSGFG